MTEKQAGGTGAHGFAFEELVGKALHHLKVRLDEDDEGWVMIIQNELQIRGFFKEPSLNGVDHMVQIEDPEGNQHLFFIQEKWKLQTKQNEVSQFLDCCARLLGRMPDYKGQVHKLWVSRTVPSQNGEKSLKEGKAILVQTCTSQTMLAFNTIIVICELLEERHIAAEILPRMGSLLPSEEDGKMEDLPVEEGAPTTFQPVSNFGEKRVLPITKQTVVRVMKSE